VTGWKPVEESPRACFDARMESVAVRLADMKTGTYEAVKHETGRYEALV
jgi:hypothetical protein